MATFTSTSERITISGTFKSFTGDSGSTTTVIQYKSGDAPSSLNAGRFLLWQNGSNTGDWEVRYIESATSTTVTVTDGGFSSAPPENSSFVISTNLTDVNSAYAGSIVRRKDRSFQILNRDFELTNGAFLADVDCHIVTKSRQTGDGYISTYPIADGCVLQFGRLIGGEANNSVETIGGCHLILEVANDTLMFTNQGTENTGGPVINWYGCLIESFDGGGNQLFVRAPGAMRMIGCIIDGPLGGRLYSADSELADDRLSGNLSGNIAWSLGNTFTRPIDNLFFFQGNTAIKAFQSFNGTFRNTTFSSSMGQIIDSSGAQSGLQFNFIDCTTFADGDITDNKGNYEQLKSINYTITDSSGTGLTGVKVAVYNNSGDVQSGGVQTSSSGSLPTIEACFFRKDHGSAAIDKSPFDIRIRKYGFVYQGFQSAVTEPIKQEVRLANNASLASTEAQAAAITGISLNFATSTATITSNHNAQSLYDYYQYQLAQTANMVYGEDLVRSGTAFNLSNWNLVVDGAIYTGDITTTGTITLSNGGLIVGTATDSVGTTTVTTLSLTGLQANSEIRVFNAGTSTEIAGVENSGTSFSANIAASSVDIVVHSLGFEYQKIEGADTSSSLTLPIQQRIDRNYDNA